MRQPLTSPKDRLRLLKRLTGRCSASVKRDTPDMRECHTAANAMMVILRSMGFTDARVLGCSAVILGNSSGVRTGMGNLTAEDEPLHSVVLVDGDLIDPTAGQFRALGIAIPDYLIIPAKIATGMLENNRWIRGEGTRLLWFEARNSSHDYQIAYIPTDNLAPVATEPVPSSIQ